MSDRIGLGKVACVLRTRPRHALGPRRWKLAVTSSELMHLRSTLPVAADIIEAETITEVVKATPLAPAFFERREFSGVARFLIPMSFAGF